MWDFFVPLPVCNVRFAIRCTLCDVYIARIVKSNDFCVIKHILAHELTYIR